jgi:hypothetical protein
MQVPMSKIPQFGAVIAIEGIYIFSLSIDGIRLLKSGKVLNANTIINYEYPVNERKYDWTTYHTDTTIQEDMVNIEITKYFNWFDNVNKKFGNYFKIDFKPWKQIDENTKFEVYYYNGNRVNIAQIPYEPMDIEVSNDNNNNNDKLNMEVSNDNNNNNDNLNMEVSNDKNDTYHERPELIDETLLKKQRINGGKKRTIKKRLRVNNNNKN